MIEKNLLQSFDERRELFIASDFQKAIAFAVEHWTHTAQRSIQQRGRFAVALSGGSTPKAIYAALAHVKDIDWKHVWLFWSDERAVPPDHPDSNYKMAMDSGFSSLPIPPSQIFRMKTDEQIEAHAREYEDIIRNRLGPHFFDLVMLGVGEDGHTASLFPQTAALSSNQLVIPNYIPHLQSWRMTFTFSCINQSRKPVIYALGSSKKNIVPRVLNAPIHSSWPASSVGTSEHKALWILDSFSADNLN